MALSIWLWHQAIELKHSFEHIVADQHMNTNLQKVMAFASCAQSGKYLIRHADSQGGCEIQGIEISTLHNYVSAA